MAFQRPDTDTKVSIQPKDIKYALEQHTELLDISQYDLENHFGGTRTCQRTFESLICFQDI